MSISNSVPELFPIKSLSVEGFKSIDMKQSIEIRPLTVLAGANSSGKSTMLQPLLLLKQTLEAPYDPGPMLIDGPNAKFTLVEQLLCKAHREKETASFSFGVSIESHCSFFFVRKRNSPLELDKIGLQLGAEYGEIREGFIPIAGSALPRWLKEDGLYRQLANSDSQMEITRNRCFFDIRIHAKGVGLPEQFATFGVNLFERCKDAIAHTIHVPGLRGNPLRNYRLNSVGERFPGTFEEYAASIIAARKDKRDGFLSRLEEDLAEVGLTWKVDAIPVDDTHVELRVGRLLKASCGGAKDLVSIADVGFGVSQSLPVVVALLAAKPGQLVYIEQPELHLHPRAQFAMSNLLIRAANRGVRVVVETHSSLLLLGIQKFVAQQQLDPAKVVMHWFRRSESTGITEITSAELDEAGRFGDWPEDFDDVNLHAQQEYLDAAEKRLVHE